MAGRCFSGELVVIAYENAEGELELHIAGELYDILVDYLASSNGGALCHLLERLGMREVARLEALAISDHSLALDYLRRCDGRQSAPRLRLVGQGTSCN